MKIYHYDSDDKYFKYSEEVAADYCLAYVATIKSRVNH